MANTDSEASTRVVNGSVWTTGQQDKPYNNNGPTNGSARLTSEAIPEEQTSLTEKSSEQKLDCYPIEGEFTDESDTECGVGECTPDWMQRCASKNCFLMVFCLAWVLQGMYHTYFVSAITTIEKLFQIQSKITGIIMSATEIGQIGSSLLLTYYGGQGHRPKWIAWGMLLFAISSFMCSLPHFIYGKQLINSNDLTGITKEPNICKAEADPLTQYDMCGNNTMAFQDSNNRYFGSEDLMSEQRIQPSVTKIVLAIFFISLLGVGMGQTAVYTLGIPYIDDNVASKESPLYFAITIGVRILGPALGFIVGSVCTSIYADLSIDPKIDTNDPRWVGAWWLGLVLISALLMLASFAMFTFPKQLPSNRRRTPRAQKKYSRKHPSIKDFPKTVKRLLKNDILMFRTASSVLHILPIAGLYTFLPKYLETQFRLPTPTANMISGVGGILVMGLGIIISGVFILRVKPNARFVAGWIAFTAIIYALGMGILMFIGCSTDDVVDIKVYDAYAPAVPYCNTTSCDCRRDKFAPICGQDGKTYLSACHAGCQNYTEVDGKITKYTNCLCLANTTSPFSGNMSFNEEFPTLGSATIGYCDINCSNFIWYIILFSVFVFIHSTSEVGSMLLILRCVEPSDKAMALGLIQFAIGLFGNVPCPIVYGAVVDSACLIWKQTCGEKGACGLYDSNVFRMFYHGTTGAILLCAFFVDVIVWYKAGKIQISEGVDEEEEEENVAEKLPLDEGLRAIMSKPPDQNKEDEN